MELCDSLGEAANNAASTEGMGLSVLEGETWSGIARCWEMKITSLKITGCWDKVIPDPRAALSLEARNSNEYESTKSNRFTEETEECLDRQVLDISNTIFPVLKLELRKSTTISRH